MIDFQHVNILPTSFISFSLHISPDFLMEAVLEELSDALAPSPHLKLLELAAYVTLQSGDKSFGELTISRTDVELVLTLLIGLGKVKSRKLQPVEATGFVYSAVQA